MNLRKCIRLVLLSCFICSMTGYLYSQSTALEFTVHAGQYERINTPLTLDITAYFSKTHTEIALFETTGGQNEWVPS